MEELLVGIAAGIALLIIAWIVKQPKPKAWLNRLVTPARPILGGPEEDATPAKGGESSWKGELMTFRDSASAVWNTLVPKFEKAGFYGASSGRDGLRLVVKLAPWPDETRNREDGELLAEGTLTDFCNRACARSGEAIFADTKEFLDFDAARRRVSEVLREWADRLDDAALLEWLRGKLEWHPGRPVQVMPYHASTLKLAWYLELAVARESGNQTAYFEFIPKVRDTLNA